MLKVTVRKPGKRLEWGANVVTSPCKFFIQDNERTHIEVLMMRNGIEKSKYRIDKVKEKSPEVQKANTTVDRRSKASAEVVSKEVKKAIAEKAPVAAPKKDAVKPEAQPVEVKKLEVKPVQPKK